MSQPLPWTPLLGGKSGKLGSILRSCGSEWALYWTVRYLAIILLFLPKLSSSTRSGGWEEIQYLYSTSSSCIFFVMLLIFYRHFVIILPSVNMQDSNHCSLQSLSNWLENLGGLVQQQIGENWRRTRKAIVFIMDNISLHVSCNMQILKS